MNVIRSVESMNGVRESSVMNGRQYEHENNVTVVVNVQGYSREDLFLELFGSALYIRTNARRLISSIVIQSKYDCDLLTAKFENNTVIVIVPTSTRPRSRIINLE